MNRVAALAVVLAAALFGTAGTAKALLAPDAPSEAIAGWRLLVGAVGLLAVASWSHLPMRNLLRHPLIYVMGLTVASYQAFFFIGTTRTGVAVGTLAALALAPFLAGALGWMLGSGAPGRIWLISTLIAVLGLCLVTFTGDTVIDPWGMAAALAAGASYAVYTVLGVRLARAGAEPTAMLALAFTLGALLLLPFVLMHLDTVASASSIVLIAWLGLGATTLGYVLFGRGLASLRPGHIATLTLTEPVIATILGVAVLGEVIAPSGWVGCLMIIAALGVLGLADRRTGAENADDHLPEDRIARA